MAILAFEASCSKNDKKEISQDMTMYRQHLLMEAGKYNELLAISDSVLKTDQASDRSKMLAFHYKGLSLMVLRRYQSALDIFKKGIQTSKHDSLLFWDVMFYIEMGQIFQEMGDLKDAELSFKEAWNVTAKPGWNKVNHKRAVSTCMSLKIALSKLELEKGNPRRALEIWEEIDETSFTPEIRLVWLGQGGILYKINGDTSAAYKCFSEALKSSVGNPNKLIIVNHLAEMLIAGGKYNDARLLLKSYLNLRNRITDPKVLRDYERNLAQAYEGCSMPDSAVSHIRMSVIFADSIADADRKTLNALMADRVRSEDVMDLQDNLAATRKWVIVAGLIALMASIIMGLWIKNLKLGKKLASREIEDLRNAMSEAYDDYEEKLSSLKVEIDNNNARLASSSVRISKIDNGLRNIRETLGASGKTSEERLAAIKLDLLDMCRSSETGKNYDLTMSKESLKLMQDLADLHPTLTRSELQLCCYISLGLTAKDIATLTQRSVRTIETIKYNLKKKLNVDSPTDVYLRSIRNI